MRGAVLDARGLTIGYRGRRGVTALASGLELTLDQGELVCLLGPNGAGKSTLMRTLTGMHPPLEGTVRLDGSDLQRISPRERARQLAVVLTERVPGGLLSSYALVGLGRYPHTGWSGALGARDHSVIQEALARVSATHLAHRPVADLSDGERQRVMMARALAQEPRLMVLDEITAFLDLPRRVEMMRLLRELTRSSGVAVLLSSHDLELALRSADRIWLLTGSGEFHQGAPEDLVLQGAFQKAFAAEGVEFDGEQGSFRLRPATRGTAALQGDGIRRLWTARALEREGIQVWQGEGHEPARRILVSPEDWWLHEAGERSRFSTLHDLVTALRKPPPVRDGMGDGPA